MFENLPERFEVAQYSPFSDEWGIWDHANKDWTVNGWGDTYKTLDKKDAEQSAEQNNKEYPW